MNHIELFAGCGGLSLGLEKAGFELVLANELSPMAAETFAYNFLKEDLEALAKLGKSSKKVFWLSSQFEDLTSRLRENPFQFPENNDGVPALPEDIRKLNGKIIVGNIVQLNQLLHKHSVLLGQLKSGFGQGGVDLISGGPPCQSFSMAGMRQKDCQKNALPWEFANFVELIQPKIALLENVTGILRPFKENGVSYYAWFEIAKAFALKGYIPLCLHINARLAGVPQNRPRFVMISIRHDIYQEIESSFNEYEHQLFSISHHFFNRVNSGQELSPNELKYFDVSRTDDLVLYQNSVLKPLVGNLEVTVKEAIGDLRFEKKSPKSSFVKKLNSFFSNTLDKTKELKNHDRRNNGALVQRRFRIYQVLLQCDTRFCKELREILKGESELLSDSAWIVFKKFKYLGENNDYVTFLDKPDFIEYLKRHPTKKQTQKALIADSPAPAALSIPDDACHYDDHELRTLTVREMARIQSFPDDFVFRSKITTGGKMRAFEVPQYTQVGNAVPPLLGHALGKVVSDLLNRVDTSSVG
ncbi:MAG: DNA (cytosine-5-)-methyltransferase [Methyloprofundus sp.]|nr:DNA (cytosine-5-)-methyltransferase [Methyloprofundus sp.]